MDEVDLIADDLNDLEARLYAQIHHEERDIPADAAAAAAAASALITATTIINSKPNNNDESERQQPNHSQQELQRQQQQQQQQKYTINRRVTATSVINRPAGSSCVPSSRYWFANTHGGRLDAGIPTSAGGKDREPAQTNDTAVLPAISNIQERTINVAEVVKSAEPAKSNNKSDISDKLQCHQKQTITITEKQQQQVQNADRESHTQKPNKFDSEQQQQHQQQQPQQKSLSLSLDSPITPTNFVLNPLAVNKRDRKILNQQERQQLLQQQRKQPPQQKGNLPCTGAKQRVQTSRESAKLKNVLELLRKKQKSHRARENMKRRKATQQGPIETIILGSSSENETDSESKDSPPSPKDKNISVVAVNVIPGNADDSDDDVIVLPTPPPQIYIVDTESEDDESARQKDKDVGDSPSDSASPQGSTSVTEAFAKPKSASRGGAGEKRNAPASVEHSPRCMSPCSSVMSTDDFIAQSDHRRLLQGDCSAMAVMAADEDLRMLNADMDVDTDMDVEARPSQPLASPSTSGKSGKNKSNNKQNNTNNKTSGNNNNTNNNNNNNKRKEQTKGISSSASGGGPKNYRVEQSQFRAMDVYESDNSSSSTASSSVAAVTIVTDDDSVYRKGQKPPKSSKPTIIREVNSDSSTDEVSIVVEPRSKRPRRDETLGVADDDGVETTPVPFIARGPAIEKCHLRRYTKSLSSRSDGDGRADADEDGGGSEGTTHGGGDTANKRRSANSMSDSEFIATIHSLARGIDHEPQPKNKKKAPKQKSVSAAETPTVVVTPDDSSDEQQQTTKVATAREIAESVLQKARKKKKKKNRSVPGPVPAPVDTIIIDDGPENPASNDKAMSLQEPAPDALPTKSLNELQKIFDEIDRMEANDDKNPEESAIEMPNKMLDRIYHIRQDEPDQTTSADNDTISKYHVHRICKRYTDDNGIGWNTEMRNFYNQSWHGENFNLKKIWRQMDPNRDLWRILPEDRFPQSYRQSNLKCYNCCEFGHTRAHCQLPRKPLVCYMCGGHGHSEPRCPNTICLRCGTKTRSFTKSCNMCSFHDELICPLCNVRGHSLNMCPDKWRRYHSTLEPNVDLNDRIQYNKRKHCCVCGGRGHYPEHCRNAGRFREYPSIVSVVRSHMKSYDEEPHHPMSEGLSFNLLYDPKESYFFSLAHLATPQNVYGRFLRAVGMEYLLTRKRKGRAIAAGPSDDDGPSTSKELRREVKRRRIAERRSKGRGNDDEVQVIEEKATAAVEIEASAPEQVQEISESGSVDEELTKGPIEATDNVEWKDESERDVSFDETSAENQMETSMEAQEPTAINDDDEEDPGNSMPDFIPLANDSTDDEDADDADASPGHLIGPNRHSRLSTVKSGGGGGSGGNARKLKTIPPMGISKKFNEFVATNDTDDENTMTDDYEAAAEMKNTANATVNTMPCEGKIYLANFDSKYLMSPDGNAFLVEQTKALDLKARIDWSSVGQVLWLSGLAMDQDHFREVLKQRLDQQRDDHRQERLLANLKVPRRPEVLIRFLQEQLGQLLGNLGNVNTLWRHVQAMERSGTRSNLKLAEKTRRLLNMILVGQAGLVDGTTNVDNLLANLSILRREHAGGDVTPKPLLDQIDADWKAIFTAYRHENYPRLVGEYNNLSVKNRMTKMNIDPMLLGLRVLDTSLSREQKAQLERAPRETLGNDKTAAAVDAVPMPPPATLRAASADQQSPTPPPPKWYCDDDDNNEQPVTNDLPSTSFTSPGTSASASADASANDESLTIHTAINTQQNPCSGRGPPPMRVWDIEPSRFTVTNSLQNDDLNLFTATVPAHQKLEKRCSNLMKRMNCVLSANDGGDGGGGGNGNGGDGGRGSGFNSNGEGGAGGTKGDRRNNGGRFNRRGNNGGGGDRFNRGDIRDHRQGRNKHNNNNRNNNNHNSNGRAHNNGNVQNNHRGKRRRRDSGRRNGNNWQRGPSAASAANFQSLVGGPNNNFTGQSAGGKMQSFNDFNFTTTTNYNN